MRNAVLGLVLLLALGDSCSSGVVGVQDYGTITGRVLDATTNKPVGNALVSVGSIYTATADAQGAFTMARIPVGDQEIAARAAGFSTASADVRVRKDRTSSAGYLRIVPLAKPDSVPTLQPPPEPTPQPTVVPTWTPTTPTPAATAPPEPATASPAASASPATP